MYLWFLRVRLGDVHLSADARRSIGSPGTGVWELRDIAARISSWVLWKRGKCANYSTISPATIIIFFLKKMLCSPCWLWTNASCFSLLSTGITGVHRQAWQCPVSCDRELLIFSQDLTKLIPSFAWLVFPNRVTSAFRFTYAYMQLLWLVLSPFVCVCLAVLWGLIHSCTFPCSFIQQIYFWAPAYPKRGSNSLHVCEGMNGVVRGCYPSGCWVARLQTLEEGVRLLACEKSTSTHAFSCRIRESKWVEIPCFILLWLYFGLGFWFLYDRTSLYDL